MSARANRVAIVGPSHVLGSDLKDRLAAAGYPGDAVELLDLDEHVGLLTEYGEEARVVLEAADETLTRFEVVCFCGDHQTTERFAPAAAAAGTAIDCTGSLALEPGVDLVAPDGSPTLSGLLVVPQAGTLLLAGIGSALDLAGAACSLALPASDFSDAGTNELSEQAAALLNFGESPDDVFGRRLAFDVWPDATRPHGAGRRISAELERLGVTAPAIHATRGSTFHGVAASLYLPTHSPEAVRAALAEVATLDGHTNDNEPVDSPARVAGLDGIHAAGLREDPAGGSWVWLTVDNHRAATATALAAVDARLGRTA
ncbi:MAG: hypothetical protein GKS06_16280 [Acidobacteria bacterium]|nr:hypothetical protein [Acidobacteriota bacterium]